MSSSAEAEHLVSVSRHGTYSADEQGRIQKRGRGTPVRIVPSGASEVFPAVALNDLLARGRRRRFSRREVVFHEGDPAGSVYVATAGHFASYKNTPHGESVLVDVIPAGQLFGDVAVLSPDHDRVVTVSALEPSEAVSLRQSEFERVRQAHPEINDGLVALLAERLQRAVERIVECRWVPAHIRVLRALARLAVLYQQGSGAVAVPLSQEQIAALAETSRDTVNRVLRREKRRGTIQLGRGRVILMDPLAMEQRAWGRSGLPIGAPTDREEPPSIRKAT